MLVCLCNANVNYDMLQSYMCEENRVFLYTRQDAGIKKCICIMLAGMTQIFQKSYSLMNN